MRRDIVLIIVVAIAAFLGGQKLADEQHRKQTDGLLQQVAGLTERVAVLSKQPAKVVQVPVPCPPCPPCPTAPPTVLSSPFPAPTAETVAPIVSSQDTAGLAAFQQDAESVRLLVDDAFVASDDYASSCTGQSTGWDSRGRQVTIDNSTTPYCINLGDRISSDFRGAAAAMPLAWEKARRAGVLPGEVRRVMWAKHLDIDWQKDDAEIRRQLVARGRASAVPQR